MCSAKKKSAKSGGFKGVRSLYRVGVFAVILVILGSVGFGVWYSQQPADKQEQIRERGIESLAWLQERKETNREVDRWIDDVIAWLSEGSVGRSVEVTVPDSDRYSLAGIPVGGDHLRILKNAGYLVGYDERMHNPAWVAYRLQYTPSGTTADRPSRFSEDPRTSSRIGHNDYTGSGYDRGHLAPNYAIGNVYGPEAQVETFLMSNITPQVPRLNRGLWRILEQEIASDWLKEFEELWVITGPIYDSSGSHLKSGVMIPSAFFKIVADLEPGNRLRIIAFLVPQSAEGFNEVDRYLVSVDEIETVSGLDFFSALNDDVEDRIEAMKVNKVWE